MKELSIQYRWFFVCVVMHVHTFRSEPLIGLNRYVVGLDIDAQSVEIATTNAEDLEVFPVWLVLVVLQSIMVFEAFSAL